MEKWKHDLDRWITTPPEKEERVAYNCAAVSCGADIMEGQDCIEDRRTDEHFCSIDCFKSWLQEDLEETLQDLVDCLRKVTEDVRTVTAETEDDDEGPDRYEE